MTSLEKRLLEWILQESTRSMCVTLKMVAERPEHLRTTRANEFPTLKALEKRGLVITDSQIEGKGRHARPVWYTTLSYGMDADDVLACIHSVLSIRDDLDELNAKVRAAGALRGT